MFTIDKNLSVEFRKKRAILFLTREHVSELLELSPITLRKIEKGEGKINSKTYQKVMEWLITEN
ncbi:hypothetical protein CBF34_10405 [Vagococcus penaei]|uniref:Uncharacterized protein n=1 Tax=Vagococcus penaei TaxID=633807 RepID=A0A1Q2D6A5_9ENTE|nr:MULTISPECIES: helix-turn-helix transcriptional regulator [Vagococcus]AQP53827.1 hypothetical protein BW732_05965 [Vagococcus penaei]MBO0436222.1 helix-turn-helix transcriptional regulator [Vagococcus fluvialis]RST98357.1 hypothetical protein CBF34_10405 [Vagococcus penaei]